MVQFFIAKKCQTVFQQPEDTQNVCASFLQGEQEEKPPAFHLQMTKMQSETSYSIKK